MAESSPTSTSRERILFIFPSRVSRFYLGYCVVTFKPRQRRCFFVNINHDPQADPKKDTPISLSSNSRRPSCDMLQTSR
jgi:hypothetical protein